MSKEHINAKRATDYVHSVSGCFFGVENYSHVIFSNPSTSGFLFMAHTYNISRLLSLAAERFPYKRALVFPESRDSTGRVAYTHVTFQQLEALSSQYARGFERQGITRGTKTLLMVRMSLDFTAVAFALFKLGAVPVMIDPGMGLAGFLACVRQVNPEGFIGVPLAHVARMIFFRTFKRVKYPVTLGKRWFWGGERLGAFPESPAPFDPVGMGADELAAILFTSGSTGPAKGVEYTHKIFDTQVRILRDEFGIGPDNIDLPCFPLFGLFSTGLGCTAVIPDMDPTRPARVNPERIIEAVNNQGVTYSFGSPAVWRAVSRHCAAERVTLPSLKRVFMAGAPVASDLHRTLLEKVLPSDADTFTPYGATEALPVSCFTGREALAETAELSQAGAGICVGKPVKDACVKIIAVNDDVIESWDDSLVLPTGDIGEIVVKGPMVTPAYFGREKQTRLAKIHGADGLWHRIGDLGYFDDQGRLWMCGRKSHRVMTGNGMMCTVRCEAIFNHHPAVSRSALVGVGDDPLNQTPVIVIELEKEGAAPAATVRRDLLAAAAANPLTAAIKTVLFHPSFPVDVRHNAKIDRGRLAAWASAGKMA
ncbi:MAG: fatty acid CoA ligase family protein [Lentisphaeria bacterium]|nr:fatty acid CoA ligase family protein [Lentisphaeria bacterium]